jgi:hypothetical protein
MSESRKTEQLVELVLLGRDLYTQRGVAELKGCAKIVELHERLLAELLSCPEIMDMLGDDKALEAS